MDLERIRQVLLSRGENYNSKTDANGMLIEESIKPLVMTLNFFGYKTRQSCGGHSLEKHLSSSEKRVGPIYFVDDYRYVQNFLDDGVDCCLIVDQAPFVHMNLSAGQPQILEVVVENYNLGNRIPWIFKEQENYFILTPEHNHSLDLLQAQIMPFTEFLYQKLR